MSADMAEMDLVKLTRSLEDYVEELSNPKDKSSWNKSVHDLVLSGVLPLSIATRFQFSSVEDILNSSNVVGARSFLLEETSKTAEEMLELYCFSMFESIWKNPYGTLISHCRSGIDDMLNLVYSTLKSRWDSGDVYYFVSLLAKYPMVESKYLSKATSPDVVSGIMDNVAITIQGDFFDPYFGIGTFLLDAKSRLIASGISETAALDKIKGTEIDARRAYIAAALLDTKGEHPGLRLAHGDPFVALRLSNELSLIDKTTTVIGNPPFHSLKEGGSTNEVLSGAFVQTMASLETKPAGLAMVLPHDKDGEKARDTVGAHWGLKKLKSLGRGAFPGVYKNTNYVIAEGSYSGPTEIEDVQGNVAVLTDDKLLGVQDHRILPILALLSEKTDKTVADRLTTAPGIHTKQVTKTFKEVPQNSQDAVGWWKSSRDLRYYREGDLKKAAKQDKAAGNTASFNNWDKGRGTHKVIVQHAPSHTHMGWFSLGQPEQMCSHTTPYMVTDSLQVSESLISFMESKLAAAIAATTKRSTANSKGNFQFIPEPPLDRVWTDEAVYDYFGLSEDLIASVNSIVDENQLKQRGK